MNDLEAYFKLQRIVCPECKGRIEFLSVYVNEECPYCKKVIKVHQFCS